MMGVKRKSMPTRTIFKYRERRVGEYVLTYRVGVLKDALALLDEHAYAWPTAPLQQKLAAIGAHLRKRGEFVDKKTIERDMMGVKTATSA
jgi:hypothetical protein